LFIDGQLVSSPVIINYANQKSSIQISDKGVALEIALIAKDAAKDNIRVNYDIQYTNGDEKMHSKPEMVLVPNQEGLNILNILKTCAESFIRPILLKGSIVKYASTPKTRVPL
jgi:hypothetical protein